MPISKYNTPEHRAKYLTPEKRQKYGELTKQWKTNHRDRYNDYQRNFMRSYKFETFFSEAKRLRNIKI